MGRFLTRRLLAAVLLLLGITLVTFLLTNVVPGDPAAANLGQRAIEDPEAVAAFNRRYGLDKPLPVQYFTYLANLFQGDFGDSQQSRRPVREDLAEYAPATFELAGTTIAISTVIGVGLGTWAAFRRDRPADWTLRVVSLAGVSIPVFWLALSALYGLTFRWPIFPGSGRLPPGAIPPDRVTGMYTVDALLDGDLATFRDAVMRLILPALVLACYAIGLITRFTRSAVLEVLGNDYVRAAYAKGLPTRTIVTRHVLRAALVPIITVIGVTFAGLLAGTVLVERIFNWPGIGSYAYLSATSLDLSAIMGVSLFVAAVYIILNLVVDVLYGVIDPRARMSVAMTDPTLDEAIAIGRRRRLRRRRPALRRPLTIIGLVIAGAWLVLVIFGDFIAPADPLAQDFPRFESPSSAHWFGTDGLGRDVLSRVILGARVTIPLALLLVVLAMAIGAAAGAVAGYFSGPVDGTIMRLSDLVFAFPPIILAMAVVASLGPGLSNAVLAIVIVAWPSYARVVRSLVLTFRGREFVAASRLLGASNRRALVVDVMPNVYGPVLVLATLELGNALLLLSGLSFLGLGARPPSPEWGAMVAEGARTFDRWWIAMFPGLAILTVVIAFNFLGDSLRDALDPRTSRALSTEAR